MSPQCASSSDTVREIKYQILHLFSLRSAELNQGLFMQDPNLSQVALRFLNVMPYGVQLVPDCNLAGMIQRSLKSLDAKCGKSGKGISLLYSFAG
jgi:hypothetical protein